MSKWPASVHRVSAEPAIVTSEGTLQKFEDLYGQDIRLCGGSPVHREDGPAIEMADGTVEWWFGGVKYATKELWENRSMVDSYIDEDHRRCWHVKGESNLRYHRTDGGPAIEYKGGDRWEWWEEGLLHREGKPAVIDNEEGITEWWVRGSLHREDGPAVESQAGKDEFWLNGQQYTEEAFFAEQGILRTRRSDNTVFYTKEFDGTRALLHRDGQPAVLYSDGAREWYQQGQLHRDDGPAVERADGTLMWYQHGRLHRDNGPAAEYFNGDTEWYLNGVLHREKGPAVVRVDGTSEWHSRGQKFASKTVDATGYAWYDAQGELHSFRDNRPAVKTDSTEEYYQHGVLHNADGPAVIHTDGKKEWFFAGKRHNDEGPAIIHASGRRAWYLEGNRVTLKEFQAYRRRLELERKETRRLEDMEKVAERVRERMIRDKQTKIDLFSQEYKHYCATLDSAQWYVSGGFKTDPNYWVEHSETARELSESYPQLRARIFGAMHAVFGTVFTEDQFISSSFIKEKFVIIDTTSPYEAYKQAYLMLNIDDGLKIGFDNSLKKAIRLAKENIGEAMLSRDDFQTKYAPALAAQRSIEDSGDWTAAAWSLAAAAMLGAVAGKALKPKKKVQKVINKQRVVEEKEQYVLAR